MYRFNVVLYTCCFLMSCAFTLGNVVFQPSFIFTTGPVVDAFLVGLNHADEPSPTLTVTLVPSNCTVATSSPSCEGNTTAGNWHLSQSQQGNLIKLTLNLTRNLHLCPQVPTEQNKFDCCTEELCVEESILITACQNGSLSASLLIQATIYANSTFTGNVSSNATVIPNQVYHPLGSCPCNLTSGACDIRCCCDTDCSSEAKQLFSQQCYTGIFGGNVTPAFDQLCSVQAAANNPDWFPFLCVNSPLENTPYLGLFYQGSTKYPDPAPSFQRTVQKTLPPLNGYRQGDPVFTSEAQYFTILQNSVNGQCLTDAPVAFLQNFNASCVTSLHCLSASNFSSVIINNGFGGSISVKSSISNRTVDLNDFLSIRSQATDLGPTQPSMFPDLQSTVLDTPSAAQANGFCEGMLLAADFTFYWQANAITNISVTVTYGNISLLEQGSLTQRFSATFVSVTTSNSQIHKTRSGNPGYQKNKPVIAAINGTTMMQTTLNLWQPVGNALCKSARTTPVLFGVDATSGCILKLSASVLNCSELRYTVRMNLISLVKITHVAMRGNSNLTDPSEWVEVIRNNTQSADNNTDHNGMCSDIPANLHIHIITAVIGAVEGVIQEAILGVKISFSTVTWQLQCGGAAGTACQNASLVQSFPVSTSVQFTQIPAQSPSPITSFQMNYTEYDCNRNEVCWPQLVYPLTIYYTGESYSQSIAKGMILVFFFITAALLGSPWNKIRQAWNNTTF